MNLNIMNAIYPLGLPIALSLVSYDAFLTGFFVLVKRRDWAGMLYFAFSFLVLLWGMGLSFMLHNEMPAETAQKWGTFSQMAALFIPAVWFHFVLLYTDQWQSFKKMALFFYAVTLLIFPFSFTSHFVAGYREIVQIKCYPVAGPAFSAFAILFVAAVISSFVVFFVACFKTQSPQKKKDYKLVCFASLYGFLAGSFTFLPVYGIAMPQYNLLAMPLWQILLAYGMIRHKIFDVDEFVQAARRDKLAAIGTLAASINHEMRNPLYIIQGLAETQIINCQEGVYQNLSVAIEKSNDVLTRIREQAFRATDIMKRFALFAKQRSDEAFQRESISMSEAVNAVLPLVKYELASEKIEFVNNVPAGFPPLQADARHVEEILFNLIVNACQAIKSSKKEGKIEVSTEGSNGHLNILIKDNGPGIPEKQLAKIFHPFHTTKEEGTGLGLYITKQLVERNGGRIKVKSKVGQGSVFTLEFEKKL